jgi:hypothetical protein
MVAGVGAVIASRSARAARRSAFEAMMSAQKKHGGTLLPPVTNLKHQKGDWAKNFIEAIDTPLATGLTIIFSIALGVSLSIFLSRSDSPSRLVPTSNPAAPSSPPLVSESPPPTATAAAPDRSEIAGLLARGRAYLSDGDVPTARVFLRRAAERNDPEATLALAETYDPAELRRLGIPNFQAQADSSKAREWYRRAAKLGAADATLRLERLQ